MMVVGDCRETLARWAAEGVRVQCVVTSPPYWGLRDYGVAGQLGLEPTPEEYVAHMVEVFRLVRDVLADDGVCWINLGDSFFGSAGSSERRAKDASGVQRPEQAYTCERCGAAFMGTNRRRFCSAACGGVDNSARAGRPPLYLKPKDLVGIPWRVAFALQADGWWLRSDIIWAKPNPMPESVTDRPTKAHEYVFLLAKSERYYYDQEAVRERTVSLDPDHISYRPNSERIAENGRKEYHAKHDMSARAYNPAGRNIRSVWTIATAPYPEAHFATFPPDLVKPCILAGTSERGCCPKCGRQWRRVVERHGAEVKSPNSTYGHGAGRQDGGRSQLVGARTDTLGWEPGCDCVEWRCTKCDTVLDHGSITVARQDAEEVRVVQQAVSAEQEEQPILFEALRESVGIQDPQDDEGPVCIDEGLRPDLHADTSIGIEERVCDGAPASDGAAHRPASPKERGRPSHRRTTVAQCDREPRGDDEAASRQTDQSGHQAHDGVPSVRARVQSARACPKCGTPLVELPLRPVPSTVLDIFMGSGTVAQVAQDLGRRWLGCELNPTYAAMCERRTRQQGLSLA